MNNALLGFTGFIGSTLAKQHAFQDTYNTKNSDAIDGKTYDIVVCAAAPGVKWMANKNPEDDWASISVLMRHLKTIHAGHFVLISTVDVYPKPLAVDEKTPINPEENSPYGKHRYMLEQFVAQTFPRHTIVRLPGIFGDGMKKNIIYDFINNNQIEKVDPNGQFQFYNVERLWKDIQIAMKNNISLINMTSKPLTAGEVYAAAFGKPLLNTGNTSPARYDMHSIHAELYGGHTYMFDKAKVLYEITQFITAQRRK